MKRIVEFLVQLREKVQRSKNVSSDKYAKLHVCPLCHVAHY
jgi:hypothetical protein